MTEKRIIDRFDLRSSLRFNIETGHISLNESRMMLMHTKAFGALRKELFDSLGTKRAQSMMLRMGFISGQQDADLACKLYGEADNYDVFSIGPELHAFEGMVKSTITESKINWDDGSFYGLVDLENCWEADSHMDLFGAGDDTACWSIAGYASGYVTRFFKRFIVFRETQCVCRGDEKCVIEGRPAEAWGDDDYINYFSADSSDFQLREMEEELNQLRGRQREHVDQGKLLGCSAGFKKAFSLLTKAADSPINVLLLGETGVGKEVFANWLHENSDRADKPFISINCGAIPHDLIEAELFGVKRGAYTGAEQSRPGRFERADGGTLLLDEVGDLSLSAQVKLLRVLQSGEVERLGDHKVRKVNVRLIAATNVNLQEAIADGRFRADLYYRLATYPVEIPPLRERKADIPILAKAMVEKFSPLYKKKLSGISDSAMELLIANEWLGNVRELENLVERGVLLAPNGGMIEIDHIFSEGIHKNLGGQVGQQGMVDDPIKAKYKKVCDELLQEGFDLHKHEAHILELAVQRSNGNLTHAANLLGITRRQLAYRLKKGES